MTQCEELQRADESRAVTAILEVGYMEDLESVALFFATAAGRRLILPMPRVALDETVIKASELLQRLRPTIVRDKGGYEANASVLVDATAAAPVGGGDVVLELLGENGVLQRLVMSRQTSAKLRGALQRAEDAAEREQRKTRQ